MKTNEFIKRVDELGFKAHKGVTCIDIVSDGFTVAKVSTYRVYVINSFCFVDVEWTNQDKLFNLIVEYAKTPIEDRKEETRFYLKHRYFKCTNGDSRYFQIYESDGTPWLNAMYTVMGYKKQFTLKEIENMGEKFHTNFEDFELVEVEDE
ncbi:hypothetical protein [Anaerococcus senegalensis]|uniref:hypothetical protein n=1 Tax=Anaerococcus senegalensis TaxID=1288120 RepID=UPI0002D3DCAD|nr:hypothetical protein [Anaerococcus senegalensis]